MKQKKFSYAKWGYIFAAPFMIAFAIFMLYPIGYTILISFSNMKGLIPPDFAILDDPFENFKTILSEPVFLKCLKNTVILWTLNFIPQIVLAFVLAVMFTNTRRKIKGQGFFKVVFYMPNIITQATIAMLFTSLFAYPIGPVNDLLTSLGILDAEFNFPQSQTAARLIVAFIQFWMWYGYTMVVLNSGILGINPEIFEAADIDGANGVQKFFRVTLPNLKTIVLFTLVTSMIGGLTMFDIPHLYNSNAGTKESIKTTSVFIYEQAFAGSNMYNRAAAASMIMFLIIGALAAVIFFVMRDKDEIAMHKIEKAQVKAFKKAYKEQKQRLKGGEN